MRGSTTRPGVVKVPCGARAGRVDSGRNSERHVPRRKAGARTTSTTGNSRRGFIDQVPPVTWPLGTLRPRLAEIRRHRRCACDIRRCGEERTSSGTTTRHTRMVPLETHAHAASCGAELEIDSTWLRQHQFCWNNTGGGAARAEHGSLRSRRRPHRSRTTATRARRATMTTLRAGGAKPA